MDGIDGCRAYSVYDDSRENGAGDSLAIIRIRGGPPELFVAAPVQAAYDAENDDAEYREDGAVCTPHKSVR